MARTDGDSWNLLSSVGATATAVAAQRAIASAGPNPLICDPYAAPLLDALGAQHYLTLAHGESADGTSDSDAVAAMVDSIAVRTRYFDDFFADAMDTAPSSRYSEREVRTLVAPGTESSVNSEAARRGVRIRQAVILASGLDARAYRLSWPDDVTVFEIDQPAVIAFKTSTLSGLGVTPVVRHRPLAVDLRDDWPGALRSAGFDPGAPTAWIAEGLLIYLSPQAGQQLLDNIAALSAPGSRIATEDVTGITAEQLSRISERMKRMGGKGSESPVSVGDLWYVGERRPASEHLGDLGWTTAVERTSELFGKYGLPLPQGRLTPFGDPAYVTAILPA